MTTNHPPFPQDDQDPYSQGVGPGQYSPGDTYDPYAYHRYGSMPAAPVPAAPMPAVPRGRSRRRRMLVGAGSGVVAAALVFAGVAIAETGTSAIAGSGSLATVTPTIPTTPTTPGGTGSGTGGSGTGGLGGGGLGGSSGTSTSARTATATQQVGIVTVVSVLKYQNAESAGTGMILTSGGEVLTNNHVVNGATSVTVTVESTGRSYRADVVGTSPTKDVAVLQLRNASGLATAKVASSANTVSVGESVIGVGNGGGTGTLTAASGAVTAVNRSITASDETGQDAERLSGLIQTDAGIISGDSGGPLYDSSGEIVGMNTAASASRQSTTTSEAYAIPIQSAISVAGQIESGVETTTIHIGLPGFIGVSTQDASGGVGITSVLSGGPAATAGITAGSVITAIDGRTVTSATALRSQLSPKSPGSKVSVTWTGADGATHTAQVTLVAGPAD